MDSLLHQDILFNHSLVIRDISQEVSGNNNNIGNRLLLPMQDGHPELLHRITSNLIWEEVMDLNQ
jgi:hypothetical protein